MGPLSTGSSIASPIGTYRYFRPLLFCLPPEFTHHLSLRAIRLCASSSIGRRALERSFAPRLIDLNQQTTAFGLAFDSPLGLAAGYDKNAVALGGFAALGFGHVEIGTVTPRPQNGNSGTRVLRLKEHGALINRMGFPSEGLECVERRLDSFRANEDHLSLHRQLPMRIGVNIGKNKDTPNASAHLDYTLLIKRLGPYADYVTINVSSPNTPHLRSLQALPSLRVLLESIMDARESSSSVSQRHLPVVVKLAPEMSIAPLDETLSLLSELNVDGVILSNTRGVKEADQLGLSGGLSGPPLFERTLELVTLARAISPEMTIIASGGVSTSHQRDQLLNAGASLVQVWTSLIYRGPSLLRAMSR